MPISGNTPLGGSLRGSRLSGSSTKSKLLITSSVLLPMTLISMVLANTITINPNAGNSIEFGQGAANTSVCESDMTTEMTSEYDLDSGVFVLQNIVIASDGPNTLGENCLNKVISVIPVKTATPAALLETMRATPTATAEVSFTLTPQATIPASDVDRILVQTE